MIVTVVKAVIEIDAGWAIGTAEDATPGIDRELLTDPAGAPWIPASSLAGSLRAHLVEHAADILLMGDRPPEEAGGGSPAPSALWLLGTRVRSKVDRTRLPTTAVIASTSVDARRGAARTGSLRSSRIVDETTVADLYIQVYGLLTADQIQLIAAWQPTIGRDQTRGAGRAKLIALGYREYDLKKRQDLDVWLQSTGPDRFAALTRVPIPPLVNPPSIELVWQITDALHLGAGSVESASDTASGSRAKVALTRTRHGRPMIPGSTWKGIFRSRARFILRTVYGADSACLEQTGCGICTLCDLFGSQQQRGRVAFGDSVIETRQQRTSSTNGRIPARIHVAIDRITGGAQDRLLFTEEIVTEGTFGLTIRPLAPWKVGYRELLLHVVRDLHDGLIGVGKGVYRGQGTIALAGDSLPVVQEMAAMAELGETRSS